jgi:hypothetical protein
MQVVHGLARNAFMPKPPPTSGVMSTAGWR